MNFVGHPPGFLDAVLQLVKLAAALSLQVASLQIAHVAKLQVAKVTSL